MNRGRFNPSVALYLSCGTSVTRLPINRPVPSQCFEWTCHRYIRLVTVQAQAQGRSLKIGFAANTPGSKIFSGIDEDTCYPKSDPKAPC